MRDREEDIRMVAEMRVQGERKKGRPKNIWMDILIELGTLQDHHPTQTTTEDRTELCFP